MSQRNGAQTDSARRAALGRAIRRHRGEVAQSELAQRLAVSQASISSWEQGGVALTAEQVAAVEAELGLRAGILLIEAGYVDESLAPTDWSLALAQQSLERAIERLTTMAVKSVTKS